MFKRTLALVAAASIALAVPASADADLVYLGDPISTGSHGEGGELEFRFTEIDEPVLPDTTFGVAGGRRDASGAYAVHMTSNEFDGSDKAPGFHAASVATESGEIPAFGYYSGPVAKVTARIGGEVAVAHQARWSEDPTITLWWFDYTTTEPSDLSAFDAAGNPLPAGHNSFGRG